ncbi:MAG: hypothetical protein V4685_17530 [Bacteroidota bacterium]
MSTKDLSKKDTLYKALSFLLLAGFLSYWIFVISLVFFSKPTRDVFPRQSLFYSSLFNQNWRLFSYTKKYSVQLNLVLRTINNSSTTDTINLAGYQMAERKKYIPFNSYEEALERLVHTTITNTGKNAENKAARLKKEVAGKDDLFYVEQSSAAIEKDNRNKDNLTNLENYARHAMHEMGIDTKGKEFQLIIFHHYILPSTAPGSPVFNTNDQTIFFSSYKPF